VVAEGTRRWGTRIAISERVLDLNRNLIAFFCLRTDGRAYSARFH